MPLTSGSPAPTLSKRSTKIALGVMSLVWVAALLAAVKSGPLLAQAAPAKHKPAAANVVNAMAFKVSETSPLPLQLQIEANVQGKQKLAYLPETGPAMDFYYLNYRPTYRAGESKIDFWMFSPKGAKIPQTASLDLYDEFGRVKLMTIVPPGTPVPKDLASKGEPFMWKSWAIPPTIKSDFDFSEKFRVVLTTSDDLASAKAKREAAIKEEEGKNGKKVGAAETKKQQKRYYLDSIVTPMYNFLVKNKSKNIQVVETGASTVVQDRIFRIKNLKATPGGKPNPAKVNINSTVPKSNTPQSANKDSTNNGQPNTGKDSSSTPQNGQGGNRQGAVSGATTVAHAHSGALYTLLAIAFGSFTVMLL
ncbi:hypothetical protein BGW42_000733 [Actinomortierella wolfii]|nr:hypothetical protein BGW42_000733 [Actinomortierella wolfii]